jgi:hypothetical protein
LKIRASYNDEIGDDDENAIKLRKDLVEESMALFAKRNQATSMQSDLIFALLKRPEDEVKIILRQKLEKIYSRPWILSWNTYEYFQDSPQEYIDLVISNFLKSSAPNQRVEFLRSIRRFGSRAYIASPFVLRLLREPRESSSNRFYSKSDLIDILVDIEGIRAESEIENEDLEVQRQIRQMESSVYSSQTIGFYQEIYFRRNRLRIALDRIKNMRVIENFENDKDQIESMKKLCGDHSGNSALQPFMLDVVKNSKHPMDVRKLALGFLEFSENRYVKSEMYRIIASASNDEDPTFLERCVALATKRDSQ